jgi:hypothetical protein
MAKSKATITMGNIGWRFFWGLISKSEGLGSDDTTLYRLD